MINKKPLLLVLLSIAVVAGIVMMTHEKGGMRKRSMKSSSGSCRMGASCADMNNECQCYCSVKCGFRDKREDDKPVYVENDPNGLGCYCKQVDLDEYNAGRCNK